MAKKTDSKWIIYVSTFPPRECGIGTFTSDLTSSIDDLFSPPIESRVVAMNIQPITKYHYARKVIHQINQDQPEDYSKVADQLNKNPKVKLINIQHEFGIFGGERGNKPYTYGTHLFYLLEKLKKPVVVTFHTVLPSPDAELKEVVRRLAEKAAGIIVMTDLSRDILLEHYQIEKEKIQVIPHGIHPTIYQPSKKAKAKFNLSRRTVLSTFGLLSRDKGIEYVLEALPDVIKKFPDLCYLIIGATHPVVRENEGEAYRNFLIKKVYDLKLNHHVRFYNKYFATGDVLEFLQATDVYIATPLNPNQAVSGTFSYALGSGRPVISTSFAQAIEYITDEIGMLVDFKNPGSYREAIIKLLSDKEKMAQMGRTAYFRTRNMTWPNVALSYVRNFSKHAAELGGEKKLPPIKMTHLARLTDNFGIFQFASFTQPDPNWGYTVDDNARALITAILYYKKFKKKFALKLIKIYVDFIEYVSSPDGHFDNYVDAKRSINAKLNQNEDLDDANARTIYALARTFASQSVPKSCRDKAGKILAPALNRHFASPRSIAFFVKGLYYLLSTKQKINTNNVDLETSLKEHCDKLLNFYEEHHSPEWEWFEDLLTYSNSIISEALLLGYTATGNKRYLEVGKITLDFLIDQTFHHDVYIPIGQSGWYKRGDKRFYFDQQPEDTAAMVQTLEIMYSVTKDEHYKKLMYRGFYWFLGDNTLHQTVYDYLTGGCYDGIGERNINLNQGAESTISYLLARLTLEEQNYVIKT